MINTCALRMTLSLALMMLASAAAADSIDLRASVRLPAEAKVVRLGDVAVLEGEEARQLADLELATIGDASRPLEIDVHEVRERLDEAGVHWGRVNLTGRKIIVRPARSTDASPPLAMTELALDGMHEPSPGIASAVPESSYLAAELVDRPTLAGVIARLLADALAVSPTDLRLTFDRASAPDLEASSAEFRIEIDPRSSLEGDAVALGVRFWSGATIARQTSLTVRPTIRCEAVRLRRDIARNESIAESDLERLADQWLTPTQRALGIGYVEAVGRVAVGHLRAGEILKEREVRRETLIRRGDRVMVRCLVGGAVLSLQAEAREDGSMGDEIEFRKVGERSSFTATVAGRAEAVIDFNRS